MHSQKRSIFFIMLTTELLERNVVVLLALNLLHIKVIRVVYTPCSNHW